MKLLIFTFLAFGSSVCQQNLTSPLTCSSRLLFSYGYQGVASPISQNALCPSVTNSCCSALDQMSMHKRWNKFMKDKLTKSYADNLAAFLTLEPVLSAKNSLLLSNASDFLNSSNVHQRLKDQMKTIVTNFTAIDYQRLSSDFADLKNGPDMKQMYDKVLTLRQGFLCSLCDYSNQNFLSAETNSVIFSNNFCTNLTNQFLPVLDKKYRLIMPYLLLLDSFALLATGKGLFSPLDRMLYDYFTRSVRKCSATKSLQDCRDFCSSFTINRLSYLFDGESDSLKNYLARYSIIIAPLSASSQLINQALFANRLMEFSPASLDAFNALNPGVQLETPAELANARRQSMSLNVDMTMISEYILRRNVTAQFQVQADTSDLASYDIFPRAPAPAQVSLFRVSFDANGLDPFKDSREMNFDVSVDGIINLFLVTNVQVTVDVEPIAQFVKDLVLDSNVGQIKDFLQDWNLDYRRYIDPVVDT